MHPSTDGNSNSAERSRVAPASQSDLASCSRADRAQITPQVLVNIGGIGGGGAPLIKVTRNYVTMHKFSLYSPFVALHLVFPIGGLIVGEIPTPPLVCSHLAHFSLTLHRHVLKHDIKERSNRCFEDHGRLATSQRETN